MTPTTATDISADLAEINAWWANGPHDSPISRSLLRVADGQHDQQTPTGVDNPYWELVRHLPSVESPWDGVTPYGWISGLSFSREMLVSRYSWAIPTPGDIAWIIDVLGGRPVVEVAAGSGYWAWQLEQAGADVIAYEPEDPADNHFVDGVEYFDLRHGDAMSARHHPDRALLMSWPSYGATWAAEALAAYGGNTFIYIGEHGGCCAEEGLFGLLDEQWEEIGQSADHRTWWGIHDRLVAYRRK